MQRLCKEKTPNTVLLSCCLVHASETSGLLDVHTPDSVVGFNTGICSQKVVDLSGSTWFVLDARVVP